MVVLRGHRADVVHVALRHRVEEESDVGGDDRLSVDAREGEVEEAIDDSREPDEGGGGIASTMFG